MPLTTGQILENRYRIDALLGQGGMGAVYRATDLRFNASVAIKENLAPTADAQKQFAREAGLLYELRHPNLPRVIDHFYIQDQGQYLVMDYIAGEDLGHILAHRGPISEAQAIAWIGQVLDALEYLHSRSVIHRDVKPANIKVCPDPSSPAAESDGRVYLVDFGLAKVYDPLLSTTVGARGVTPGYAPPEQYGMGRTDACSDLYSVGATLYALMTGQAPPDALEIMTGRAACLPPRQLNPAISPRTEAAVLRAMQSRPADRFQTAAEFRAALVTPAPTGRAPAGKATLAPAAPSPIHGPTAPHHKRLALPAWSWPLTTGLLVLALILLIVSPALRGSGSHGSQSPTPQPTALPVAQLMATPSATSTNIAPPLPSSTPTTAASPTASGTPTPTSTPTPSPSLTPSPSPTFTLSPLPTATTPARTPTPVPPTRTPKPTASPLRGKIAFYIAKQREPQVEPGVYLMDLASGKRTRIDYGRNPVLSHDGSKLVFAWEWGNTSPGLTLMDLRTGQRTQLTTTSTDHAPAISWSGTQVAYYNSTGSNVMWHAATYVWENGNVRSVVEGYDPCWSPDDQWIAFGRTGLFKVSPWGGTPVKLVDKGDDCAWGISNRIAFVRDNDIYIMNADGSGQVRLTDHPANDYDPAWSPDGARLIFVSERDGNAELYIINADGSDLVRLTTTKEPESSPSWSP